MTVQEIWCSVVINKRVIRHYKVSNFGQIKSLDRVIQYKQKEYFKKGTILKQQTRKDGYKQVMIYINKKAKRQYVHRLVASAFIPNLKNKPEVNHKNGIKSDNKFSNLEWVTDSEQRYHAEANGLCRKQPRKLNKDQVQQLRNLWAEGYSVGKLMKIFPLKSKALRDIVSRRTYKDC